MVTIACDQLVSWVFVGVQKATSTSMKSASVRQPLLKVFPVSLLSVTNRTSYHVSEIIDREVWGHYQVIDLVFIDCLNQLCQFALFN